ncbi:MAG: hypothetical protein IPL51_09275 [Candidatus Competibacteraceae bacterium]|nr:hypothetical protein [Candidatus Competibacteraceae bacterium]
MNDDRHDELHDETIAELYRQTRDVGPPSWLDQRVLKAAESAVAPHPTSRLKSRKSRWMVPLALAATVVLTTGVLRMADEAGEFRGLSSPEPARSKVEAAGAASADIGNTRLLQDERARSSLPEAASPAAVLSAEVPASAPAAASPAARLEGAISRSARQEASDSARQEASDAALSKTAPAKPAAALPQAPAAEAKKPDRLEKAAPAEPQARRERLDRSPEQWLKDIAELRRQGRTAEADERLAEFRRRYPDYPLGALEAAPR